ncbi:uncharacterized protein V1510DRAFT_422983 [Dipodascopsis tothii]|uniref:uncharacterized protein n=1 Tax=Dipodascopsis tothii TaxID=44089 RepID=UPI0034CF04CA
MKRSLKLATRLLNLVAGLAAAVWSVLYVRATRNDIYDVLSHPAVYMTSAVNFCTTWVFVLGILSTLVSATAALLTRYRVKRVLGLNGAYTAFYTDLTFVVLWALTLPILVVEYSEDQSTKLTFRSQTGCCVASLLFWSVLLGFDSAGTWLGPDKPETPDDDSLPSPPAPVNGYVYNLWTARRRAAEKSMYLYRP